MATKADSVIFEGSTRPVTLPTTFDPATQVSADAKYIVKQLVLWFLGLPLVLTLGAWAIYNATH